MSSRANRAAERWRKKNEAKRTLHRRGEKPQEESPNMPEGNSRNPNAPAFPGVWADGQPYPEAKPTAPRTTGVSWDDVVGLDDAKEALREALVYPFEHRELYATYGQVPPKGVLLYGPPGCGKTMLGKAAATAVGANLDNPKEGGFQYVAGNELSDKYMGETSAKIRALFQRARVYAQRTGKPGVIFVDEADAALSQRGGSRFTGRWSDPDSVPAFLAEMDGIRAPGSVFVMLGTNAQDALDEAIVRDGRIDRRIEVPRPNATGVAHLIRLTLGKAPLHGVTVDEAAERIASLVFGTDLVVRDVAEIEGRKISIHLHDCINGAAAVGIARRAIGYAIARDRKAGELVQASGVRLSDLERGAADLAHELRGTNLRDVAWSVVSKAIGEEAARRWGTSADKPASERIVN